MNSTHKKWICLLLCLICFSSSTWAQREVESEFIRITSPYPTAIEGEVITLNYEVIKPAGQARVRAASLNAVTIDSTASTFTFKVKNTLGVDYATFFFLLVREGGAIASQVQLTLPITNDHLTTLILYGSGSPVVNKEFAPSTSGQVKFEIGTDKKQCTSVRINEMEVSIAVRGKAESKTYYGNAFSVYDFPGATEGSLLTVRVVRASCERPDHSMSSFGLPPERMMIKAKVTTSAKRVPSAQ